MDAGAGLDDLFEPLSLCLDAESVLSRSSNSRLADVLISPCCRATTCSMWC